MHDVMWIGMAGVAEYILVAHPCGTSMWHSHLAISCGIPMWNTHVAHPFGTPMWHSQVEHPCDTPRWQPPMTSGIDGYGMTFQNGSVTTIALVFHGSDTFPISQNKLKWCKFQENRLIISNIFCFTFFVFQSTA